LANEDKPEGWTKEEYLAYLRRPPDERNTESNVEKGLFWSFSLIPEVIFGLVLAFIAAGIAVYRLVLS